MVELQIVVLAVAGSSPVDHPAFNFGQPPPPKRLRRPESGYGGWIRNCTLGTAAALLPFCALAQTLRCVPTTHAYRPLLEIMKRIGLIVLAGLGFFLVPGQLFAQSDDPNETFLKAYMTSQQGE